MNSIERAGFHLGSTHLFWFELFSFKYHANIFLNQLKLTGTLFGLQLFTSRIRFIFLAVLIGRPGQQKMLAEWISTDNGLKLAN